MDLNYLDFDGCDDGDGAMSWDAMASIAPQRLPQALREAEAVLRWAHSAFGLPDTNDAELAQWHFDVQLVQASAAHSTRDLDPRFGAATGHLKAHAAQQEGGLCVLTLTLSGSATFGDAFTAQFAWA